MRTYSKLWFCLIVSVLLLPITVANAQKKKDQVAQEKKSDMIFENYEEMPMFPGGPAALKTYLKESIRYPQEALNQKAEGRVIVEFVVYDDGTIGEAKIEKPVHNALDQEAMRIVYSMPRWSPKKVNGKAEKCKYRVAIDFKLPDKATSEKVFDVVEQMPMFPGGPAAMKEYIATNVKYPDECKGTGLRGRVVVSFIVNEDGSLSDIKVAHPTNPAFDKEAMRVVSIMPKWVPGQQNGKIVKVRYNVPVNFGL